MLRSSLALLQQLRLSAADLLLLNSTSSSHLVSALQQLPVHQRQQRYSDAPAAARDDSAHSAVQASETAVPQQQQLAATSSAAAAAAQLQQRPFLPTHLVLKAVRDTSEAPLNSHQLYDYVQQQYGAPFTSRAQFKQNLKHVQKKRWVSARPVPPAAGADAAAAAGSKRRKKKAQAAEANFVFTLTPGGKRQDLDSRGSNLDVAARAAADEWTRQHMPAYMQALAEGRLPVTRDNMDLLLEPAQQQQPQQ